MYVPKTAKGFLKLMIAISESGLCDISMSTNTSKDEHYKIGSLIAGIQNDLGEMPDVLKKYNLKYPI